MVCKKMILCVAVALFCLAGGLQVCMATESDGDCNNHADNKSYPKNPCSDPDTISNPFWAYNGDVKRSVVDLALADGAGDDKLAFERIASCRWPDNYVSELGSGGNWRHRYFWRMIQSGSNPYGAVYHISTPYGGSLYFYKMSGSDLYFGGGAGSDQNLLQSSLDPNQFYLLKPNGERVAFYRGANGVFQSQGFYDKYERFYSFAYDNKGRLAQVTDPITNHFLRLQYGYPTNATPPGIVPLSWQDPTATSVLIAATWNGCDFPTVTVAPWTPTMIENTNVGHGQNAVGEVFDMSTNGGCLATTWDHGRPGFGSFGKVYVNYDSTNLYIGAVGSYIQQSNQLAAIFLGFDTLSDNATALPVDGEFAPYGITRMANLSFARPMDIAILLGDEGGDATYKYSGIEDESWVGQGVFYLSSCAPVSGAVISQFDGQGTNATQTTDDDGNRLTDRWLVKIPWSSLNAGGLQSLQTLDVAGVHAGPAESPRVSYDTNGQPHVSYMYLRRKISANYLGDSASGIIGDDNNFGYNEVVLAGTRLRLPGQAPYWNTNADTVAFMDLSASPGMSSASPVISGDPSGAPQNNIGDAFDFATGGGSLGTSGTGSWGSFGSVYMNCDSSNLYIGGVGLDMGGSNNAAIIFLDLNTLTDNASNFWDISGEPLGLLNLHNVYFERPMDIAILLGDEWGDLTEYGFQIGSGYAFGQGVFYLGGEYFTAVPGCRISQFDGTGTNATTSSDDDGNRITERWEVSIPWSSLNAADASSLKHCVIAGLIASDYASLGSRYLSGRFLGDSASGTKDGNDNFALNTVTLKGSYVRPPGYVSNGKLLPAGGGLWTGAVNLAEGTYEYKFLINGTNWVADTNNPLAHANNEGASQIIIPPELLLSVSASDGRSVGYEYDFIAVDGIGHAALRAANYGDGTSARYSYRQPAANNRLRPMLASVDDPMVPPPYSRVAYTYQAEAPFASAIFGVSGMIYEERNLVTSQLIARLTGTASGDRLVEYGDGTSEVYAYSPDHPTGVTAITNAVGEVRQYTYDAAGMRKDFVDAAGRVFERGLTPYFGVVTSSVSSAGGSKYWRYTDNNYPVHLAQEVDELGRATTYTRDGSNRVTRVDYPDGTYEAFTHTAFGQVVTERRRDGAVWSNTWNALGRLMAVTDPSGNQAQFGYDEHGRIASVTDALGHVRQAAYDWRGKMTSLVDPDGAALTLQCDNYGHVTNAIMPSGGEYSTTYDAWGFPSSQADPLGFTTSYQYDHKQRLLCATIPSGLTISNIYDGANRKIRETRYPEEVSREWSYGPDGVVTQINRLGHASWVSYDSRGNVQSITRPSGIRSSYAYDLAGNLIFQTNALGEAIAFSYDQADRLQSVRDCSGAVVSNTYDGVGRLVQRRDALGNVDAVEYDTEGNAICLRRNGMVLLSNVVNEVGWIVSSRDASGVVVSNDYDAVGRLTRRTMPDGSYEQFTYTNGWLFQHTDRGGRTVTYWRDVAGQITNEVDEAGHSIRYAYDALGQVTLVTDPNGNATRYAYDEVGRQTNMVYPDSTQHAYTYDAAGQLVAERDAVGRVLFREYNRDGLLTVLDYESDPDVTYEYDLLDRLSLVVDGVGTTAFEHVSGCSKVHSEDGPFQGDVVTYGYDLNRRITNIVVAGQSISYAYDEMSRLDRVAGPEGSTIWTFEGAGHRPSTIQRANGVVTRCAYDTLFRLTNILHETAGGSPLASFGYTFNDANERIRIVKESGMTVDLDYDDAGRLTSAHGSQPGYDFAYAYDGAGNQLRREQNGFVLSNTFNSLNQQIQSTWGGVLTVLGEASTTGATVTVNGRMAAVLDDGSFVATNISLASGGNTITALITDRFGRVGTNTVHVRAEHRVLSYDLMGNLTNDGERTYGYDQANRLVAVRDAGSGEMLMTCCYDGFGRRRQRVQWVNGVGTTNRYVYDGWLLLAVLDGSDHVLETYTQGPDLFSGLGSAGGVGGLIAGRVSSASGTNHWFLHDDIGNVVRVVDDAEAVKARYDYSPYGQPLVASDGVGFQARFSGKEWDSSAGAYYFGRRHYQPGSARWMSRDPLGQRDHPNVYLYVGASPLNRVDPIGLSTCDAIPEDDFRDPPPQLCAASTTRLKPRDDDFDKSREQLKAFRDFLSSIPDFSLGPEWDLDKWSDLARTKGVQYALDAWAAMFLEHMDGFDPMDSGPSYITVDRPLTYGDRSSRDIKAAMLMRFLGERLAQAYLNLKRMAKGQKDLIETHNCWPKPITPNPTSDTFNPNGGGGPPTGYYVVPKG